MKLNFIQNLSDEVVRENHQLKSSLLELKQRLKDYENNMVELIEQVFPKQLFISTPEQILDRFIKMVRKEFADYNVLKAHAQRLQAHLDDLVVENIHIKKTLLEKNNQNGILIRQWQEDRKQWEQKSFEFNQNIGKLQKYGETLKRQMHETKIEKLKLQQEKRNQIELIRQNNNNDTLAFKQKIEEEHFKIQKQLKKELLSRDKMIKDMGKNLQKLANLKSADNNEDILAQIFKSLQSYEELAAINKEIKQENEELRKEVKDLFKQVITTETKVLQLKANESNLLSQLERIFIQKQFVESELLVKINEINKSEKDKQAMQQYYDQKWNSQYKKVKQKLQKDYYSKINQLEENYQMKLKEMEIKMIDALNVKNVLQIANKDLQVIYQNDKMEKHTLSSEIQRRIVQTEQLKRANYEQGLMAAQQIQMIKHMSFLSYLQFQFQISKRQIIIKQVNQQFTNFKLEQSQAFKRCQLMHEQAICQTKRQSQEQKQNIIKHYLQQINSLNTQISIKLESIEEVKQTSSKQFILKVQAEQVRFQRTLQLKQDEYKLKYQKYVDMVTENQALMSVIKKKSEDERQYFQKEINKLQERLYQLRLEKDQIAKEKNQFQQQNKMLEQNLEGQRQQMAILTAKIKAVEHQLKVATMEVQFLLQNRKTWQTELFELRRQYSKEFDSLKKINQQQLELLKQKIRELEILQRRNIIPKKQYDKIRTLSNEKDVLRQEIHLKEAENVILHQVKDYYETKLRQAQSGIGKQQFKSNHSILARKLKKNRLQANQCLSQRIFEHQITNKKRYVIQSTKKNFNLSLSKSNFKDSYRKLRVNTAVSIK